MILQHLLPPSRSLCLTATALVTACRAEPTGPRPDERPESELRVVRLAHTAPPLFNAEVSFWAFWGRDHTERIYFRDAQGQRGDEFVELDLDGASLLAHPDGRPILPGDSVRITMRVVDPVRILIQLDPSGLQFNPLAPAELEISYRYADPDFNGDGRVNDADRRIEARLAIWRQPVLGMPFLRLLTLRFEARKELEAELLGFSRMAVAY
jgi:hypothetical protein